MSLDLREMIARRSGERFALHERHLNGQLVKVLRTIGFDRRYVAARGQYLFDAEGHRYLDLLSGFGVFAVGRNHETVNGALHQVLEADLPNLVQMDVSVLSGILAEKLLQRVPSLERAFFCNSGAEAVEAAIKFARMATRRKRILYCKNGFHGLTYGALSLTGDELFRSGFEPVLADCQAIPFNDLPALEAALEPDDVAAFVVEPIQGKGVNVPDDDYLREAARLCRRRGTLLVLDEIQTGMGRTGRFVAAEHWGVEADMILLAKALSGGHVPVGAVLLRSWIFDRVFDRMDRCVVHGSTFSKNDLAMAAGIATLTVLEEEKLIANAATRGEEIMVDLRAIQAKCDVVREIRGRGLMIGIEFGALKGLGGRTTWALLDRVQKGLFCQTIVIPLFKDHRILCQVAAHGLPVVKLLPPLVIGEEDRAWIAEAFGDVIASSQNLSGAAWDLLRHLVAQATSSNDSANAA